MLENTVQVARGTFDREVERVSDETVTMSGDLSAISSSAIDDPRFCEGLRPPGANPQPLRSDHHQHRARRSRRALALSTPYDRPLEKIITPQARGAGEKRRACR
jgi:hypothetical protein